MEKRLARFVLRDGGEGAVRDGLILGALFTDGQSFFKAGHVYEIAEVLGQIVVRECGPSWIKPTVKSGRVVKTDEGEEYEVSNLVCWGNGVGHILDGSGKCLLLTEEEYLSLLR